MTKIKVLKMALVGKRIVGVQITQTESGFLFHKPGKVSLILEGGEMITFKVERPKHYPVISAEMCGQEVEIWGTRKHCF